MCKQFCQICYGISQHNIPQKMGHLRHQNIAFWTTRKNSRKTMEALKSLQYRFEVGLVSYCSSWILVRSIEPNKIKSNIMHLWMEYLPLLSGSLLQFMHISIVYIYFYHTEANSVQYHNQINLRICCRDS